MTLMRKEIRKKIVEILAEAGVAGGRISSSRVRPVPDDEIFTGSVYTRAEQYSGTGPFDVPTFETSLTLVIELFVVDEDEEAVADILDDQTDAALDAILKNTAFMRMIEEVKSISVEMRLPPDGDRIYGHVRITMNIGYQSFFEPVIADDFLTASGISPEFGVNIHAPQGQTDVDFSIDIPQ